jgi:hypothetical protein
LKELARRLAVVDENILVEAARQPTLFLDASRLRVAKMRLRSAAELSAEVIEARVWLHERARADASGEKPRVTDTYVNQRVKRHPRVREAKEQLGALKATEELSKLLLEAYRMRRDGIKIIHEAQLAEGRAGSGQLERAKLEQQMRDQARRIVDRSDEDE